MFNRLAVHVRDPQATIGAGADGCWTEPGIGGCKEFALLFAGGFRGALSAEGDALRFQDHPANEIVYRLADEGVASEGFAIQIIAVDGEAVGGGVNGGLARCSGGDAMIFD